MLIVDIDIDTLVLDPENVRIHPDKNIEAIKSSLEKFGQQKPLVVTKKGIVAAGNGTLIAAKDLGWTTIKCVVTDLKGTELEAYKVADNRTGDMSEFDPVKLSGLIQDLDNMDYSVESLGFSELEIAPLMLDNIELEGKPKTKRKSVTFDPEAFKVVKRAIDQTGLTNSEAIVEICRRFNESS